jgi:predicted regulator of Ras-like GTPase activity (Roadblock/LC7/MglB family)
MANIKNVVSKLQHHYKDAKSVAIISKSGKLLYSTKNWNIKSDIKNLLASWASNSAQSVTVDSIRYSIVQMEPERFIATNRHKKGHLIGAVSPDGDNYMVAQINPKAKGWFHLAYPAVARAAAMLSKGTKSEFIETEVDMEKGDLTQTYQNLSKVGEIHIEPYLKAEVEAFLEWIKNPEGLSSYISYYLQQNDPNIISQLAKYYDELYRLFYT